MLLPQVITAGDTLRHICTLQAYPAGQGWVLNHRLVPRASSAGAVTMATTASGDSHLLEVAATTTAQFVPGDYLALAWVVGALGDTVTVSSGQGVRINPNPRTLAAGTDGRTLAQRALDDARAAFAAWSPTHRAYTIGSRSMTYATAADILPVISYWETQVARERRAANTAAGRPDPRRMTVRLNR